MEELQVGRITTNDGVSLIVLHFITNEQHDMMFKLDKIKQVYESPRAAEAFHMRIDSFDNIRIILHHYIFIILDHLY